MIKKNINRNQGESPLKKFEKHAISTITCQPTIKLFQN